MQVLHISNGDTLNEKLKAPGNRVEKLLELRREGCRTRAMVDEIYLACLARYPTEAERDAAARPAARRRARRTSGQSSRTCSGAC